MEIGIVNYILLFMVYSIAGWLLEVGCKLKEYKRFINRGFLIGPYCPIYGFGAVLITLLLYKYAYDPIILFIMTMVTCGILEYMTSLVMEKVFKARWWDYSKRKFNINGRVCLGTMIPFGIFGMILIYGTNPLLINLINIIPNNIINIIVGIFVIVYIIDFIVSTIVIMGFRKTTVDVLKEDWKDNTEEITAKVRQALRSRSWTHRRLINAFPKFETIKLRIKEISEDIKENVKETRESIEERTNAIKEKFQD